MLQKIKFFNASIKVLSSFKSFELVILCGFKWLSSDCGEI